MNVVPVAQCRKKALRETRRILDQFAERRGDRTWQTAITKAGLDTLRRMLRQSARKNTAVACHWIRGRDHSELLWTVGDASRFNFRGAVPTNTTRTDILRRADENDWHTLTDIHLLAALAALFHDFGKACKAFQKKLRGADRERNLYRHEWVSLRLLQAFAGDDSDEGWLTRLQDAKAIDEEAWLARLIRDGLDDRQPLPLSALPPIAEAVGWLILTHHRLPVHPSYDTAGQQRRIGSRAERINAQSLPALPQEITAAWNEIEDATEAKHIRPYWDFPHGLPSRSDAWCKRASRLARQTLARRPRMPASWLGETYVLHIARLCLMLSDHHYSSLSGHARNTSTQGDPGYPLYANTDKGELAQRLDDHLLGVTRGVGEIAHRLPDMVDALPRIARHKGFRKRSRNTRFRWQDRAFDLATSIRDRTRDQGFFGINMASTGCGKTLANGRIVYALADPDRGARFTVALGLRTLTLQTGEAYRRHLGLGADDLAVRVGGAATRKLFEYRQRQAEATGSASTEALFDEDSYVHFDGQIDDHPLLARVVKSPHARSLIAAPVLVCTIDHIVPATESLRGGQQIAPMLRLMGSDLILDEPDDFGLEDLPALTRLVHWAGLLGSRVLLSSATLPPALVTGLFDAYRAGRVEYQKNRGEPSRPVDVCCAWFDEGDRAQHDCANTQAFQARHDTFAKRRSARLAKAEVRRRAEIAPVALAGRKSEDIRHEFANQLRAHAVTLHTRHHSIDPHTGHRVSFGLIRMANINPLIDVALALYQFDAPENVRFHLCVYHSQFPLLIRSAIEHRLDTALARHDESAVFELPEIRKPLDTHHEPDQLFIVLGSPVTEVGRDHDYDWAVVEPSAMRSIIQLAGRVRRHRQGACSTPNLVLLDKNLKALEQPGQPAYCRPGFEDTEHLFASHAVSDLLNENEYDPVDARPRLLEREPLAPANSLVDLEHARLRKQMAVPALPTPAEPPKPERKLSKRERKEQRRAPEKPPLAAYSCHAAPELLLSGILPQQQRFRRQDRAEIELALLPNDSETDYILVRTEWQKKGPPIETEVDKGLNHRIPDAELHAERITRWGGTDYIEALAELAEAREMTLETCARTFGTLSLADTERGWLFHPALGFRQR